MDWEEWAPLLFLGKERHQVGKEDKEIVKEVRFFYSELKVPVYFFRLEIATGLTARWGLLLQTIWPS